MTLTLPRLLGTAVFWTILAILRAGQVFADTRVVDRWWGGMVVLISFALAIIAQGVVDRIRKSKQ